MQGAVLRHALWRPEKAGRRDGGREAGAVPDSATGEIRSDPGYLAGILREGAERVAPIANATVRLVKQRMGLYM